MKKHRNFGWPTMRFHCYLKHILSFRVFWNHSIEASKMNENVIKKLSKSEQNLIEKGYGKKVKFQYAFLMTLVTFGVYFWNNKWYTKVMKN